MNLNLGLESLNGSASGAAVPFTPASAIEMQNASEAITNLMASLENYYDAARNAMLVKKAVKKYGKTQSIVALIGQEGLAAAQSFSMEGFWQKTKDFLWRIWSKIKEWWGRFWGMFFSIEDRLRNFESSLNNKILIQACEFDGPDVGAKDDSDKTNTIFGRSKKAKTGVGILELAARGNDPSSYLNDLKALESDATDVHNATVSESGFATKHYKYTQVSKIREVAKALAEEVFAKHRTSKKDIDRYTDDFLRKIKDMKVSGPNSASNQGRSNAVRDRSSQYELDSKGERDLSSEENDDAVQLVKMSAKVNNKLVSSTLKAATTFAVKLMANTRTKNT